MRNRLKRNILNSNPKKGTIHPQAVAHAVHAAPVALTHAAPVALTHAAPVAIHAQPLAIQSHAQIGKILLI